MLGRALRARATARLAVLGLVVGLFALAGLAQWSNAVADRDNAQLDRVNDIAATWGTLFETLNTQDTAMADYLNAGDEIGRRPLESAILLSAGELGWLRKHSEPDRVAEVVGVAETYDSYTATLTTMVQLGRRGDERALQARAKMASLIADTLHKQIAANIASRRLQTTEYLKRTREFNHQLKTVGFAVFGVELVLVLLCSAVLLNHQRRIERQAAESGHRAVHDALTGLPNRVLLGTRMEEALKAADGTADTVALLVIDLDRFKEVNDTLGHHYGDLLLQVVATRLQREVRADDTVARLGGDEFAVLVPAARGAGEADLLAKRILAALRRPADLNGVPVDVDGSIGVALYPSHSDNASELLQHADIAMYTAKHGRLGTAVYEVDGPAPRQAGFPAAALHGLPVG
jgi:diguanylate cyclase (GGDEF)-like protein